MPRLMKIKALIADDEPLARERLRFLLSGQEEVEVAGECRNGKEVIAALKKSRFDVLFLDIQMPGRDGFEVIEQIGPAHMPVTVFVTAHNEYAVEAFEVHALDYLVKPIERKRLDEALTRVKERIRLEEAFSARREISSVLNTLRTSAGQDSYPQRFLAKNGNSDAVVPVADIEWIEAADYYV